MICGNPIKLEDPQDEGTTPLLRNDQIFTLIRMCGGSGCLTKEECFILMKKIHLKQKKTVISAARRPNNFSMDDANRSQNNELQE